MSRCSGSGSRASFSVYAVTTDKHLAAAALESYQAPLRRTDAFVTMMSWSE